MKATDKLKIAGKELIRGNIGNAFKALSYSVPVNAGSYRGMQGEFWMFNQTGGVDIHFSYSDIRSSLKAYTHCPPVTAIINRKAQAFINGKTWILNKSGKGKGKEATGDIAKKVNALINKPNPLQSWKQFEAQNYIYQQVSGYCVVLPIKPVGFGNIDATKLWNIPPWMLDIVEKKNINFSTASSVKDLVESITFVWENQRTPLPLDDIYIFKDFTPSASSFVFPESRIKTLKQNVNNIVGALESMGVLIDNRGPLYVISSNKSDDSGNIALSSKEKEELLSEFKSKYGLSKQQSQAIITSANVSVSSIGYSVKELMLHEGIDLDTQIICDGYNYPYRLLSSNKSNSLGGSDIKAFKALLYQDAIIPEAESMYEQWNQFFELDKYNLIIDKDFKHITALQEDQLNQAKARRERDNAALMEFQNNMLTLNDWRRLNDEDPLENEIGDKYYYELVAMGIAFGKGCQLNVALDGNNTDQNQNNGSNNNA